MITSVHQILTHNLGDLVCSPAFYFDGFKELSCKTKNQKNYNINVIFGGGGLFPSLLPKENLSFCEATGRVFFIWGCGSNSHENITSGINSVHYLEGIEKARLIGIRDFGGKYRYVPCVSCLFSGFKKRNTTPIEEIKVYYHRDKKIDLLFSKRCNFMKGEINRQNKIKEFNKTIDFLNSGEKIITNTYHGAYWSLLLGKKVLLYEPFSSRFNFLKIKLPVCDRNNWREKVKELNNYYDNIDLESYYKECVHLNLQFASEVFSIIGEN